MSFFFQAEDGIRDIGVTGVQTCALPIFGLVMSERVRTSLPPERRFNPPFGALERMPPRMPPPRPPRMPPNSGERRGGEEGRTRWAPDHLKKKNTQLGYAAYVVQNN